jgi:superfamily II DNA or RNA helicase
MAHSKSKTLKSRKPKRVRSRKPKREKKPPGNYCKSKTLDLYPYQRAVARWFKDHPEQKGMLVQFGTGTGKTLVAANLAEMMLAKGVVRRALVIAPTSLVDNFYKAIRICRNSSPIPVNYLVETYGRVINMVNARRGLTSMREAEALKKKYPNHAWFSRKAMKNTLLIIDEAHNLKNIASQRTKAVMGLARAAKHVLLLTATPFVNSVADISPLMQMIVKDKDLKLWPANEKAFRQAYEKRGRRYARALDTNIAYHYADEKGLKPEVVRHVHRVDLKKEQVRVIEGIRADMGKAMRQFLRAYLRQEELPPGTDMTNLNRYLTRMRQAANTLHGECSPKVKALVDKAVKGPKPVVIYSQFKGQGVETVKRCLLEAGVSGDKIAYFHGSLSQGERSRIIRDYNHRVYDYLLLTSAGSEGLSLKATRQVHVLEPFWNMAKIMQVLGRGVRVDSHGHLPPRERRVDVSYWISVVPEELKKKFGKTEDTDLTTLQPDVHVWRAARKKEAEIDTMNEFHASKSIPLVDEIRTKKKTGIGSRKKRGMPVPRKKK